VKALRIYHSGVVGAWRRRDAELRRLGADLTLISSVAWDEGGQVVTLAADDQPFVVGAPTWGHHPFLFVYDPRPIWRALRAGPVDLLDIHEEPASLAVAEVLLLARLAGRGRPAVCLYCAQNIEKRYPPPFRWLERAALRRATAVHTCNEEAGRILRRKGFSGILRNLGLGVDVERFAPEAAAAPALHGALRVGYVGRLEAHKGVGVLLEAVARLPEIELTVVGEGPEREALNRQIATLGLADRVTVQGFAAHDRLPDLYRTFDVLVVPSLETGSWIEQFGRVAVEAMAVGVAVVASESGSLPEVLAGSGVLVRPGDVDALADVLARLRDDPAARARLVAAGRRRAGHFSWPALAERHLALYQEMIG
jgi:glycosyltransferase involved in cell wall biosynthesis